MLDELIGKQIICKKLGTLQFMYPSFKVVTYPNEIEKGVPFIFVGDIKYINSVSKREEPFIIVSFTGFYDLDKREDLIKLAFMKHRKKVPSYVKDLIKYWPEDKFYYNWKLLYINGTFEHKDLENDRKFYEIIEHFSRPYNLVLNYLNHCAVVENKFFESSLVSFMLNSKNINNENTKNYKSLKLRQSFANSYSKNIKYSIENILESTITLDALRFLSLLLDLLFGEENEYYRK